MPVAERTMIPKDAVLEIPEGYAVKAQAHGDLDNDGLDELVVVYTTNGKDELDGFIRDVHVYKYENEKYVKWYSSETVALGSNSGGMMGDPFDGLEINNGVILIKHWGGSSWKWSTVYKFRQQNGDLKLIGHTSDYGKIGEYWTSYDWNLNTGMCDYKKEIFRQGSDEVIQTDSMLLNLGKHEHLFSSFVVSENKLKIPEVEDTLYY
jgi:hypothetical protein